MDQSVRARRRPRHRSPRPAFAALDLGTNNCRLLIAEAQGAGLRVVDGFSQIVRLGEGLALTGRLGEPAMARTIAALKLCAEKIRRRHVQAIRCIATEACRQAANGPQFLAQIEAETGLVFEVVSPEAEARLSVIGCAALISPRAEAALVIDIGGGSTEMAWVRGAGAAANPTQAEVLALASLPFGVVTIADRTGTAIETEAGFRAQVADIASAIEALGADVGLKESFAAGRAHHVGASGTITSLAAVHLRLARYERAKVDGVWMRAADVAATIAEVRQMSLGERAASPAIGPERADLVLPGAAILAAVAQVWPAPEIRVADRGLREGVLLSLMAEAAA